MCVTNITSKRNGGNAAQLFKPIADIIPSQKLDKPSDVAIVSNQNKSVSIKKHRCRSRRAKTAKNHTRLFVVHDYHDHAQEDPDCSDHSFRCDESLRYPDALFPVKLHYVLADAEQYRWEHIISWSPHGRCFAIKNPVAFVSQIMPKYFHQTKLTSFQRQLNLYGFIRLTHGPDRGCYYHEYFLHGMPSLTRHMVCTKVKGSGIKAASSPDQEPDFYALPPIGVVHGESECDMSSHGAPTTGINDNFDRLVARISAIPPGPTDEDDISVLDENIVDA